ncbi:hypothetical protein L484_019334 [Morus notabilis]|uniref:Uncharacterized protein n=1 Tax=Morus notabilis TaxID=981085 RepID=W9RB02_9ROSA|nr:hypothetical protein L484_019334 [Morus notabilis]
MGTRSSPKTAPYFHYGTYITFHHFDRFPGPPLRFTYARRRPRRVRVDVAARDEVEAGEVETVRGEKGAHIERAQGAAELTTG